MTQRGLFYIRYAFRSLRREGIRTVLACLSIAFSVLSLVAMQSLSGTLMDGSLFDEHLRYGGDAQITSATGGMPFTADELKQIDDWQKNDLIRQSTQVANGTAGYLRTPTSGRVTFLMSATGINPASYPLAGQFVLREPAGKSPAEVLVNPTDALLTRDLADMLGLHVGDTFLLSGGDVAPASLTLAGILQATPNQEGKSIFYTLTTAQMLENRPDVITSVSVLWGDAPDAAQTLIDSPLSVFIARSHEEMANGNVATNLFDLMLKGAGVLGLLVGGLGVSNTLQVILARRRLEIAMLKTLGFRREHLLLLIGLETALLGLTGSIIGAAAGVALGGKLLDILGGTGAILIDWSPPASVVIGGVLAGMSTAVVFGLQAILASSATRPIELLRDMPLKTPLAVVAARAALFGVLILVFGALVGFVLGNIVTGIACVIFGGLLLIVLRGVFWVVLWGVLKLPVPPLPMLRMARASLRRRKNQSSLVVIALFAGAFAVTFAALVIFNAQTTIQERRPSDEGYNLVVYASVANAAQIATQISDQGAESVYTRYLVNGRLNDTPVVIEGRAVADLAADIQVENAWDGAENTALLPDTYASTYTVGDSLTLNANNHDQSVTVAGFYTTTGSYDTHITGVADGIIVAPSTAIAIGGDRLQVSVIGSIPVAQLNTVTDALGQALPDALVFSKADLNNLLITTFQSLFTFAVSIAGLAFVAGAVLIANATGLAVVERRREIGIFKAVGYTSGHVLRLFLGEYGMLGFISGVFGIIGAMIAILLINLSLPGAEMVIDPAITLGMLLVSIAVATGSAALVAWQPSHARPLDVLRYE